MEILHHPAKNRHGPRRMILTGLAVAALAIGGCGQGGAITDLRMTADKRPDLNKQNAERGKISLPADEPFNYPQFRSGQEGPTAHGEAKAQGNNGAICRADVAEESSAWGEFQLGYCFDNMTGEALDAVLKINLTATTSASHKESAPTGQAKVDATGEIVFFVKDSDGLILRQEQLLVTDLNRGQTSTTNRHALVFDARFEPDRGYYLVLAGRCEIDGAPAQSASLSVEVADVSFEINWRGTTQTGVALPVERRYASDSRLTPLPGATDSPRN